MCVSVSVQQKASQATPVFAWVLLKAEGLAGPFLSKSQNCSIIGRCAQGAEALLPPSGKQRGCCGGCFRSVYGLGARALLKARVCVHRCAFMSVLYAYMGMHILACMFVLHFTRFCVFPVHARLHGSV